MAKGDRLPWETIALGKESCRQLGRAAEDVRPIKILGLSQGQSMPEAAEANPAEIH